MTSATYCTVDALSMNTLMKKISLFFIFPCLLIAALFSIVQAAEVPTLEDIEYSAPSPDEERITFKLNGTYIPKIFAIKGEQPRVVFDFPKTRIAGTLNNIIKTNGNFIKQIRIGLHKGKNPKTRVVLDLRPDREINFDQNFDQQKNALTVSVYYAGTVPSLPKGKVPGKKALPAKEKIKKESPEPSPADKVTKPATTPQEKAKKTASATTATDISEAELPQVQAGKDKKTGTSIKKPAQPQSIASTPANQPKVKKNAMPVLQSVTFDNTSNRGEMIQFKLSEFHPPIVFGIEEGLPRVVCDFKNTRMDSLLKNLIKTKGRYVKAIRIGRHNNPEKIRVVIDLEPNNNYDLQQVFFKEDNLFVIIVNTIRDTPPVQELEKPSAK
jgi:hypothetical protein